MTRLRLPPLVILFAASAACAQNWPQFRGEGARGVADGQKPPTTWDGTQDKNVRWKTAIPGLGHSSPVIWGEQIFLTTAVSAADQAGIKHGLYGDIASVKDESPHTWHVLCLDKRTGKIVWDRVAHEGVPKVKRHTKATHANSTAATDGRHVVACFGSEGLHCYDTAGKLLWKKDLGVLDSGFYAVPEAQWEFGSSPVIYNDMVVLQCDVQKDSFVAAFDIKDGREIWRTPRTDVPTWCTPTVHEGGSRTQVICNGHRHMGGYDIADGKEIWKMGGGSDIPVPTPFVAHGLFFLCNSHGPPSPVYAVRTTASGDISLKGDEKSNAYVAWSRKGRASYMPTPIVVGDVLYVWDDRGIVTGYDAKTGEEHFRKRVTDNAAFTGSPVAADGRLYNTSEDGDTYVLKAGKEYELLATCPLGEVVLTTAAISDGSIFIRSTKHLWRLGEK